ncbi:helix-turn-helix domain-containing protein [Pseudoalteromonas aurantia]|uniref:HTH araC/xylS-type domain-containing protein n=1 Tax=Pseudoalteromonas aurantia 208 TaxID=1314867 RepID=A0ABR9EDJ5_9GAMM|nr:AraC family transcriptional regulator [Pseudoalteromonas aurantia]MBE0369040.1 hypothetical protein [Pseudoalteromonas aurantia 208]
MLQIFIEITRNFYVLTLLLGCLLCFLLLTNKSKTQACSLLSVWILVFTLELVQVALIFFNVVQYKSYLTFDPFYGPLFYLYARSLIHNTRLSHNDIFHLLPISASYLFMFTWPFCFGVVCALGYSVYTLIHLKQPMFTQETRKNLIWLRRLSQYQLSTWVIVFAMLCIDNVFPVPLSKWVSLASYIPMSVGLFILTYLNLTKPNTVQRLSSLEDISSPQNKFKCAEHVDLVKKLTYAMQSEKLFLNPQLSLSELAEHIKINNTDVSATLNICLQMSFYDFVNQYRIDEAKRLLCKSRCKILAVAYDAGFNSKSNFNRLFKAHTGVTPSQYRKHSCAIESPQFAN